MDRNNPYFGRVELLVRTLPVVAKQESFALKGGTAINLFVRDLPRLSVDIDLVYLPLDDRKTALAASDAALGAIAAQLKESIPKLSIEKTNPRETDSLRLLLRQDIPQIKIELSPVLRGTVWPVEARDVVPQVEETFGFARIQVVSLHDLFAGKICAALDRQHPRDLFDIKLLLENEGVSRDLFRTFLVYLISHPRPIAELLSPTRKDIAGIFETEFRDMAQQPVELADLLQAREQLIAAIHAGLTGEDRKFLLSMKARKPDWSLLGLKGIDELPAVRWKLQNLDRMTAARHEQAFRRLESVLAGAESAA